MDPVTLGDCDACDPCGSGSGAGSGDGPPVTTACCDTPVRRHLSMTVQDLGANTGLFWLQPGSYGLKYYTGGTFSPNTPAGWVWDGSGTPTGNAECVGSLSGGITADSSWLVAPADAPVPEAGDGTNCTFTPTSNGGPLVNMALWCAETGDGPVWQFNGAYHTYSTATFPHTAIDRSFFLDPLLSSGTPVETVTLVSCDPFLLVIELENVTAGMHVVLTFSE